jgi:serine/threonine protein kinase
MTVPLNVGASELNVELANYHATTEGRYVFQRELGKGAFGKVFLAKDRQRGGDVAIKLIAIPSQLKAWDYLMSALGVGSSRLSDAQREANLLRMLRHDYVIGYIDSFKFQTDTVAGVGIVMRYCPGGNLGNYLLRKGKPSEQRRLRWSRELAEGMAFVHSKGVVHRDLKPDNILIDGDDCLKIADIGLAKAVWDIQQSVLSGPRAAVITLNQYLTSVKGTAIYIAPEVITGHYKSACDVFSLGLVFAAIIEAPVYQVTVNEKIIAPLATWRGAKYPYGPLLHENQSVRQLMASSLLPLGSASTGERKLIEQMLLFNPDSRHDMDAVVSILQFLEDVQHLPRVAVGIRDPPPPPEPKSGCCN